MYGRPTRMYGCSKTSTAAAVLEGALGRRNQPGERNLSCAGSAPQGHLSQQLCSALLWLHSNIALGCRISASTSPVSWEDGDASPFIAPHLQLQMEGGEQSL